MKIIKSTISIFLVLMLLFVSIVPAFAVDISTSEINMWSNNYFESIFNLDRNKFKNFESLVNERLQDRKVNNSIMYFTSDVNKFYFILTDGVFYSICNYDNKTDTYFEERVQDCTYALFLECSFDDSVCLLKSVLGNSSSYFRSSFSDKISNCYTSDDVKYANNSSLTFYKSENIYQNFLSWINGENLFDVDDVGKRYLKYYDGFKSYYGDLSQSYYGEDNIKNFLNSSITFDDEIYYMSNVDKTSTTAFQHNEIIDFYIKPNDTFQSYFKKVFGSGAVNSGSFLLNKDNYLDYAIDYLNNHTICKHYKNGIISFDDWFSNSNVGKMSIVNSMQNKDVYYIHFKLSNSYSWLRVIFQGHRVDTNATLFNFSTGGTDNTVGIGSNIDDANNVPTRQSLIDSGWTNGYPNQSGNYPYCVTISRNGSPYIKIYFKSKPPVTSYKYTDNQIRYTFDMKNLQGYIYFVDYNVSKQFDFPEIQKISNNELKAVVNAFSIGTSVAACVTGNVTLEIASIIFDVCSMLADLGADYNVICNYQIILWTNYVGSKSNYNGFICTFNWNIGTDNTFHRENSDDDYNYSDDYVQDKPASEQATDASGNIITGNNYYYTYNYYYSDNNGNIHGGGDDTYIATEPPTASDLVYGNVDNFDFSAPTLWNYTTNFMGFLGNAFSIVPSFIWLILASGAVIVVVLRILGR